MHLLLFDCISERDIIKKTTTEAYGPLPAAVKNVHLVVRNGAAEGWGQENGGWAYYQNGIKLVSKWLMATSWQYIAGNGYYLGTDGIMVTGTKVIDGVACTFDSSGAMVK